MATANHFDLSFDLDGVLDMDLGYPITTSDTTQANTPKDSEQRITESNTLVSSLPTVATDGVCSVCMEDFQIEIFPAVIRSKLRSAGKLNWLKLHKPSLSPYHTIKGSSSACIALRYGELTAEDVAVLIEQLVTNSASSVSLITNRLAMSRIIYIHSTNGCVGPRLYEVCMEDFDQSVLLGKQVPCGGHLYHETCIINHVALRLSLCNSCTL
ncbi:hypothetical protein JRO89_XS04G0225000 [Xanthoceras sorbifolium]|uniref:RING-type domain-containing protein n=1 Tax=Xanthoceras sorbifolium TaxID=99658 RepID=A0ABQ8I6I8_9ROSI|nr:hypothetical protein JRO89_XS04G0225000 [Xanthoceras sorbifolium]